MIAEDIIEGLNRNIEDVRKKLHINTTGHLILQKDIILSPTFKAYKEYRYIVWFYKDNKYYPVINIQKTERIVNGQEENIIKYLDIDLANQLFNLIRTPIYIQIIKGDYKYNLHNSTYETIKI